MGLRREFVRERAARSEGVRDEQMVSKSSTGRRWRDICEGMMGNETRRGEPVFNR